MQYADRAICETQKRRFSLGRPDGRCAFIPKPFAVAGHLRIGSAAASIEALGAIEDGQPLDQQGTRRLKIRFHGVPCPSSTQALARSVALTEGRVGYRRMSTPKVRRCLRAGNNPLGNGEREPEYDARLPPKPVRKPTKWPRSQQAMSEVRRCLRTRAGHLGNREADSRQLRAQRAFHRQTATQSRWTCPRTSGPSILGNSSGPSHGRPADDRPGSFGSDCQKAIQEIEGKPPEFGFIKPSWRLGGVATQRPAKPFTPVRFR
jgi:hypothetical protein